MLTETRVTIDGVTSYPALVNLKQRWNGFLAEPWFTHEQVLSIAEWLAEHEDPTSDYQRLDLERADIEEDPATDHIEPFVAILSTNGEAIEQASRVIDGVRYYAIGALEWVWSVATPEPIHTVGSIDNYGGIAVKILADTGRQVTMQVLTARDGLAVDDIIIRNYR